MAESRPVFGGTGSDSESFEAALSYREILGRRLLLNSRLRFGVGGALLVGPWVAVATQVMDVAPALLLSGASAALLVFNAFLFRRVRAYMRPEGGSRSYDQLRRLVYTAVAADYVVLALSVALLGGIRSPVTVFYLLHVVLGNILLTRDAAITVSVAAYVLICAQAYLELVGVAPAPGVHFAPLATPLDGPTAFLFMSGYGVLFILTDALMISLVERLRGGERALILKNELMDQLSQVRQEFLRVAVHNMRAPVGASQMLLENLVAGLAGPLNAQQQDWLLRVGRRMEGLQEMLQDLQIMGQLEAEDLQEQAEEVELADVLRDVCADYDEQARSVGLDLKVVEGEGVPPVLGIRRLLREAVVNFVTNAIKYAPRSGDLVLATQVLIADVGPWVRVEVRDRGPGIPPEASRQLFREFARGVQREAGPEHPASSGLGLAITRRIVESHGGRVGGENAPGGGATFWIELPSAEVARAGRG